MICGPQPAKGNVEHMLVARLVTRNRVTHSVRSSSQRSPLRFQTRTFVTLAVTVRCRATANGVVVPAPEVGAGVPTTAVAGSVSRRACRT